MSGGRASAQGRKPAGKGLGKAAWLPTLWAPPPWHPHFLPATGQSPSACERSQTLPLARKQHPITCAVFLVICLPSPLPFKPKTCQLPRVLVGRCHAHCPPVPAGGSFSFPLSRLCCFHLVGSTPTLPSPFRLFCHNCSRLWDEAKGW